MTDFPPSNPPPIVQPGDTVVVQPKNPFASTAVWGLVVAGVNLGIQKLAASGKLPKGLEEVVRNAAFEIIMYAIGAGMILYGRWRAARPLGFGRLKSVEVK